jgi:sigma-B regulation protein RsbU (phosphoserine phosphatase)
VSFCEAGKTSLADIDAASRQRELDDAREIQAGLLPHSLPLLPGIRLAASWRPARIVAGDYDDVLPLGEGLAALCIADVTGKGMPAALLVSNLQATVKAFATADLPPRRLCERVNQVMSANIAPGRFITFFYGLLDAQRRTLAYVNAGHNPPIILHADSTVHWLDIGGLLLGVFPEATYEEAVVELWPGDRLLVYTDGVTEAGSAAGKLFGEERLVEALRSAASDPKEMQRVVLEAAAAFCGGEFEDDATVIAAVVD